MLYEIPLFTKEQLPEWEHGVGSILATSSNGTIVEIPILAQTNVLTVGITGTGKTKSYTLQAANHLLNSNLMMKGVFLKPNGHFLMRSCRRMTRSSPTILPLCLRATCSSGV